MQCSTGLEREVPPLDDIVVVWKRPYRMLQDSWSRGEKEISTKN
jgi:hypothetical protein